jgi:hypothetical protein
MNRVAGLVLAGLVVLLLNVTLTQSQENRCPQVGEPSVPCDPGNNCFHSCCLFGSPETAGVCPAFSCAVSLGAPNDVGTTCSGQCLDEVACDLFNPSCPDNDPVCIGTVRCKTANCDGRQAGDACLIAGNVIKVCSDLPL